MEFYGSYRPKDSLLVNWPAGIDERRYECVWTIPDRSAAATRCSQTSPSRHHNDAATTRQWRDNRGRLSFPGTEAPYLSENTDQNAAFPAACIA